MKAGDIVYNSEIFVTKSRGELEEFLCDAIDAALGSEDCDRLSNGMVVDALLRFLDIAVTTPEQISKLEEFLKDA